MCANTAPDNKKQPDPRPRVGGPLIFSPAFRGGAFESSPPSLHLVFVVRGGVGVEFLTLINQTQTMPPNRGAGRDFVAFSAKLDQKEAPGKRHGAPVGVGILCRQTHATT